MKENKSLRSSGLISLIVTGSSLWLFVLVWPAVAHSQQETQQQETHWPTHYVIVVRNTALEIKGFGELLSKDDFRTVINSIPMELEAASRQIPLWRKPEPGDLISVVFAAAGKFPISKPGCKSSHYPDPSEPNQKIQLEPDEYFDVRAHIVVGEHNLPSDIADPSSKLYQELLQSLVLEDCDLVATYYSEALTLAEGLSFVETGDENWEEKYEQFFLLVLDLASPAYGSTEFNATFDASHDDLAPGTPMYLNALIGSLKFEKGNWSSDLVNYLDYPADEPGTRDGWFKKNKSKFYPRLRFYRAVAHEIRSDPFYNLDTAQRETKRLSLQIAQREQEIHKHEQKIDQLEEDLEEVTTTSLVARIVAVTFALLMVLVTWRWWAIRGRFRRMAEEYQNAVCIPDAPNTNLASESA